MEVTMIHRSDLVITSKATALEFYKGIRSTVIIPYNDTYVLRIEPNQCFSVIAKASIADGTAWMTPSVVDLDGIRAFRYRKYINAYLRRGDEK